MDWIAWLLFESLLALGVALFILNFFLLVHWRRTGRPRALLIGLGVSVLLLAMQALVETRKEIADRLLSRAERDVKAGVLRELPPVLSDDFRSLDLDREAFLDFAQRGLDDVSVYLLRRARMLVGKDAGDGGFRATVGYQAFLSVRNEQRSVGSEWEIEFARDESGHWRIRRIRPVTVGGRSIREWDRVRP